MPFFQMPSEISWRGPFCIQAALALMLIIWSLFLPETPRWLIKSGFKTEGLWALADLQGDGDITSPVVAENYSLIVEALEFELQQAEKEDATWKELFVKYSRRTFVGVTSQMFSQLNGINAILHFMPENFDRAGYSSQESLLYAGACAILYCAGTIPTLFYIDRVADDRSFS
jgi:hypothetical protein